MKTTESGSSIVLMPDFTFDELARRLETQGWIRRPAAPATSSILPGEPEFAQWRSDSDGTPLTYTFNPVVHLRVLHLAGESSTDHQQTLAPTFPTLGPAEITRAVEAGDTRTVLRGILAASELGVWALAGPIGLLANHPEVSVARTAARVHLELLHRKATALAHGDLDDLNAALSAICGNVLPLLSSLPGAAPDEILGLQPTEEDCEVVFSAGLGQRVFEAYAALWTRPPQVAPGSDRHELTVHACPASLFTTPNRFSNAFPAGYRDVARYLRPDRVWLAWRYSVPGNVSGLAMDGLVHARGNWVWYPKVHAVLGQQIHPR